LVGAINDADHPAQPPTTKVASAPAATANAARPTPSTATTVASTSTPAATANAARPALSTPTAAGGNAVLSITSGFSVQPGAPNPLAGRPYVLLRDSYASVLAKAGVPVPVGTSPYKVMRSACANRTPDCQKITAAVNAAAASAARADANGKAIFPEVAAGTYYLMISARYNNQPLVWDMPVHLKAGENSLTLDQTNATPLR